jgi:hypothetical protein
LSLDKISYVPDYYNIPIEFSYIDNEVVYRNKNNNTNNNEKLNEITKNNNNIEKNFYYKITQTSLGPFDYDQNEVKAFLNDVTAFRMTFSYKTYYPVYYEDNFKCTLWTIEQKYHYTHRSHFEVNLDIENHYCTDYTMIYNFEDFMNKLMWIHIIVLVLAVVSLSMTWRHIKKLAAMFVRVKNKKKVKNFYKIFIL